jgi:hypothetical protein
MAKLESERLRRRARRKRRGAARPAAPPAPGEAGGTEQADAFTVVVVAQRAPEDPFGSARSVTALDAAAFDDAAARTVPEGLAEVPGVFVRQTNPAGGAPIIRGLVGPQNLADFSHIGHVFHGAASWLCRRLRARGVRGRRSLHGALDRGLGRRRLGAESVRERSRGPSAERDPLAAGEACLRVARGAAAHRSRVGVRGQGLTTYPRGDDPNRARARARARPTTTDDRHTRFAVMSGAPVRRCSPEAPPEACRGYASIRSRARRSCRPCEPRARARGRAASGA